MRNRRKILALGWCCMLALALFVSCATVEEPVKNNPKTVVGTAAGTAGGALLGGVLFKSTGGAVVGSLLGGLAGGLIGNTLETQSKDRATTVQDYNYASTQGTVVQIEKVEAEPISIRAGEKVNLIARYALLTPQPGQKVTVTERWDITRGKELAGNPVHTVQRQGGTWGSAIPITLHTTARSGNYHVALTLEAGGSRDTAELSFNVR
jgi:outer membrane lipoprotein SlyB